MQLLRAKFLHKGSVDPTLKAWSQGSVGTKSFRQINDEFAEIVIARVFEREGRKVSRVAERLKMSPKKVRKILARVGRRKPRGRVKICRFAILSIRLVVFIEADLQFPHFFPA